MERSSGRFGLLPGVHPAATTLTSKKWQTGGAKAHLQAFDKISDWVSTQVANFFASLAKQRGVDAKKEAPPEQLGRGLVERDLTRRSSAAATRGACSLRHPRR